MHTSFCIEDQTLILDKLSPPKISKILALLLVHCNTSHLPFSQPVHPHDLSPADSLADSEAPCTYI